MLPFFNKYPYTNFEQLNLDWMMNTIGSFDARITKNTEDIHALDIRVTVAEGDIDDLQDRMTTAEGDIDDLQERMTTAEGDIDDLQDRMTTAEGDIDDLQDRMTTAEGDIDDLETVVGDDNSGIIKDINDLSSSMQNIPIVTANPVGTPTGSLSTLGIDDDIYTISGGGGGSGTEVIANPTGTAAADLETVSIAGIIYDIPTADLNSLTNRVNDLETVVGDSSGGLVKDVNDLETVVGDSSGGIVKDLNDLETVVGDSSGGLVKGVDDLETVVGDSSGGLVKDVDDLENITSFLADDCLYDSYSSITDATIGVNYNESGHNTLPAGTYVGFTSYKFSLKPSVSAASNYLYEFYTATRQLSGASNYLAGAWNYVLVPFNNASNDVTISIPVIIKSDGTTKLDCSYTVYACNGAPANAKYDVLISNRLIRVR